MIGILQAETLKLLRHRGIWGLVWIVPVVFTLLWLLIVGLRIGGAFPDTEPNLPPTATGWIAGTAVIWQFATNSFARYLVGGFAALAFAGEYGWSTWKLIVPHRGRMKLIGAKYLVVLALPMAAFVLTAILSILFDTIDSLTFGPALPDGISFGALLSRHAAGFAATLLSTLLTIAYTATAAILFRSTLAGVIVTIVVVTLERLAVTFAMMLPKWVSMVLPGYHLDNVQSWIANGRTAPMLLPSGMVDLGWPTSALVLLLWLGGLIGLTVWRFREQDLV